jgi:hypothetical protein
MRMVGAWGDRQNPADRLDPVSSAMIVDERDHGLDRRSSSAIAKYADALRRISLAWRSSRFSRSSTMPKPMSARWPRLWLLPAVWCGAMWQTCPGRLKSKFAADSALEGSNQSSQQTQRWREPDSNSPSHRKGEPFRRPPHWFCTPSIGIERKQDGPGRAGLQRARSSNAHGESQRSPGGDQGRDGGLALI